VGNYDPSVPITDTNAPGMDGPDPYGTFMTFQGGPSSSGGYIRVGGVPVPLALYKAMNLQDLGA
jgi:hypothetical protein